MRFGINLRGDLAKLDDAEIASRYEALISDKEAKHRALPIYTTAPLLYRLGTRFLLGRGLFHARVFYQIQALVVGFFAASEQSLLPLSAYDLYMLECELEDVRDEIKRRVQYRKTAVATQ